MVRNHFLTPGMYQAGYLKVGCLFQAVEGFSQTIHVMSVTASLSFAKLWLENTCVGSIAWRTPAIPTPCFSKAEVW